MIYKELGRTGLKIPVLGFGTWTVGGKELPNYHRDDEYIDIIKNGIELGLTLIDTAELYGRGHAEELVGEAIKKFERENIFIISKVLPKNLRKNDLFNSIENSLKRLKTDYIDLYLIHSYTSGAPLEEALISLNEAVEKGLIRNIGVSNFNKELLAETMKISPLPITCNQVYYNIENRKPEENGLLEYCQSKGLTLIAYRPFQQGKIEKKIIPILKKIAENHDATMYQIIIAWLISKERVVTIFNSSKIEHIIENIKAQQIKLTEKEIKLLDEIKI